MKYIITFLLFCSLSFGQNINLGGNPVSGVKQITRTDKSVSNSKNTTTVPSHLDATPGSPTGSSSEVGVTEGQLNVSLSGAANYSIPLNIPSGINGVVPQIGIAYDSQGGIGNAGYGWNIFGLSKISRIPSTVFHDGKNTAVDCSDNDRFALDGQRLIVKNGTTGVYGAVGTVYETENFSNIKITSYGTTPYVGYSVGVKGPDYFIVEYPDGSKAKYGGGYSFTSALEWNIEYWENAQGIRINYGYQLSGTNLMPTGITYGYKGAAPTGNNFNQIQFIYKSRQRYETAYVDGIRFQNYGVLSEIKISNNGVGYRNYIFDYDTSSLGYERLTKITEKSGDNTKSYNPTVFTYDTTPNAVTYSNITTSLNVSNVNYTNSVTTSGDFDGDGKRDIIMYPTTGADAKKKYWLFNHLEDGSLNVGYEHNIGAFEELFPISWLGGSASYGYKLMPMQGWCAVKNNLTTNVTSFTNYSIGTASQIYFQDNKDYIFPKYNISTQSIETTASNASNYKNIEKKFVSGDFNGDGLSDILAIELNREFLLPNSLTKNVGPGGGGPETVNYVGQTYFVNLDRRLTSNYVTTAGNINAEAGNNALIVDDVNGDGKSDLLVFTSGVVKVYSMDTNNQLQLFSTTTDGNISSYGQILMGDYNGDGKTDFIIPKGIGNNYAKFTATGRGFKKEDVVYDIPNQQNSVTGSCYTVNYIMPTDFDKDGKTDLVCATSYACTDTGAGSITIRNFKNTGTNFVAEPGLLAGYATTGIQAGIGTYPVPVFLNNDKQNSRNEVNFITNNRIIHFNTQKDFSKDKLLRSITLGNGVKQVINYSSLKIIDSQSSETPSFYPSTYTENYPNFDITVLLDLSIVSSLEMASHTVYKRQNYNYYGAVTNLQGLGFLGFRGMAKSNWFNDNFTQISNISKYDVTKRGVLSEQISFIGQILYGTDFTSYAPVGYVDRTLYTTDYQLLANKVFKLNNTVTTNIDGPTNVSTEVSTTYDPVYNYTKKITVLTKNGSAVEETKITDFDYDNSLPNDPIYFVGRLNLKKDSVNNITDSKTSEENYSYTNNLLTETQKKGNLTNFIKENNDYNTFGNIIKKTLTAVGLPARITSYEYDTSEKFLIKIITPDLLQSTFSYDLNKYLLLSETNPFGQATQYSYDVWGKKIGVTDYLGNLLNTSYGVSGNGYSYVINSRTADGIFNISVYDDLGRLEMASSKNIDNKHSSVQTQYDIYDRKISVSEPYNYLATVPNLFNTTTFDIYGRVEKITEASGKITTFSYSGLTSTAVDNIKTISSLKNANGSNKSVTDNGGTINYTYFADGNVKSTEFDGNIVAMKYDGWGRKSELKDPSAGVYQYAYNEFGELTDEISPKGTTHYLLDPLGKVMEKTIIGAGADTTNSKTTYTYNPTNTTLLATASYNDLTDGNHQIDYSYTYDSSKRIILSAETNVNKSEFIHEVKYDGFGRVSKQYYKATNLQNGQYSDKWIRNEYKNGSHWKIFDDSDNKLLWVTNSVNERGQATSVGYGNGINISNTYDNFGYLTQAKHDLVNGNNVTNIMTLNNSFNPITGNLTNKSNSLFGTNETFKYDNLDRLIEWAGAPRVMFNLTFKNHVENFQPVNGASVSISAEKLKIVASDPQSGAQKLIIENATLGDQYKVKLTVDDGVTGTGVYQIRAVMVEEDPNSGTTQEYVLGNNLADGNFEANYTIQNSNYKVYIRFDKSEDLSYMVILRKFFIDDLIISKTFGLEKQSYDNKGRIAQNNLGSYNYTKSNSTPPNNYPNTSIFPTLESSSYYDANPLQNVTYNAFKSPIQITQEGIDKVSFLYNDANGRSDMYYGGLDDDKSLRCKQKFYSTDGTMEIKYDACGGTSTFLTYIGGDAYSAPIVLKGDGNNKQYLYLHRDYQGSILGITNELGQIVEKRLFDPWGSIAYMQDGNGVNLSELLVLDRGYTGHEHLLSVGLIHMNGRLYDPKLHRFLQPDNLVQDPNNTQNYNRYGYVMNNPTKYVDYSGEDYENGAPHDQYPGPSNTQQTWIGNGISTIAQNWDNWGIKDWSNRNLNFSRWGDGVKSVGQFLARNLESVGGWFNSIFGGGKEEETQNLPSSPTFSNHQLSSGWQSQGSSSNAYGLGTRSDKIIMNTIRNNPALYRQYRRIMAVDPGYKIKYVDVMKRKDEAKSFNLHDVKSNVNNHYTEVYRAGCDINGKPLEKLDYVIMHEFGHVWSSISGYRASNFIKYPAKGAQMPEWMDEIYADLFANHWGGYPLTSQNYIINLTSVQGSTYYENGLIIFPKKF